MPLIRWDGGVHARKVLKEQQVQQRRLFLEELHKRREEIEQPKRMTDQSQVPETSATLVENSDSECSTSEGLLPLQLTTDSVQPEGRLDIEEMPSAWPYTEDMQTLVLEPPLITKWDVVLKEGPASAIDLD